MFTVAFAIAIVVYMICCATGEVHFEFLPAIAGGVVVLWFLVYAKFMSKVRRKINKHVPANPDENPPST
jgi:Ca2+/Na+ antiporter